MRKEEKEHTLFAQQLENQYLEAYHTLYQTGVELHHAICRLRPPQNTRYAPSDLIQFQAMMEALYQRYPEQYFLEKQQQAAHLPPETLSDDLYRRQQHAKDIAQITGLPQPSLIHYQMQHAMRGLYTLICSVNPLIHQVWVALYFRLEGIPSPERDFFQPDVAIASSGILKDARKQYYQAGQHFTKIRERLITLVDTLFRYEQEPHRKSYWFFKRIIYEILSQKAGLANRSGKSTGNYPLLEEKMEDSFGFGQAFAHVAECVGVPYGDILYIFRRREELGLMELILHCTWLEEREQLLVPFPHYRDRRYQSELRRMKKRLQPD